MPTPPARPPEVTATLEDLKELLARMKDADGKMAADNEHKAVLRDAGRWLVLLAQRVMDLQTAQQQAERRIVLPGEN